MSFYYVATPYTKYPGGTEEAFHEAARQTGRLLKAGVMAFSPIVATHAVAQYGGIPHEIDNPMWLRLDEALMRAAAGLIVVMMNGWEQSVGVAHEIDFFERVGKPIIYMMPGRVPEALLEPA